MLDYVLDKIDHIIHKDNYLDTYLINIISDKTGFNPKKIKLLTASKSNMKTNNNFDTFSFKYEGLIYELFKDELKISQQQDNF